VVKSTALLQYDDGAVRTALEQEHFLEDNHVIPMLSRIDWYHTPLTNTAMNIIIHLQLITHP